MRKFNPVFLLTKKSAIVICVLSICIISKAQNTKYGTNALFSNTTGTNNTALGANSVYKNTSGNSNTAVGYNALYANTTGSSNTALGYSANVSTGVLTNATAIGNGAIVTLSNAIQLGNSTVTKVFAGTTNKATLVAGGLQITGGTLGAGKVLTSNAVGVATWQTPAAGNDWSLTGNIGTVAGTNFIGTKDAVDLVLKTNNTEKIRVTYTGNVGIGTAAPATKLQVYDGGSGVNASELFSLKTSYTSNSAPKAMTWRDDANITAQIDTRYDGTKVNMIFGHLFNFNYQTSDLMAILGNGNVGIGTIKPTTKLQVYDGGSGVSASELFSLKTSYTSNSAPKAMTWRDDANITAQIDTRFDGTKMNMVFGHLFNFGYQATDLMTILGNGNVAIGTVDATKPGYKLFVEQGILTEKVRVAVKNSGDWSDYVFDKKYELPSLHQVEDFIKINQHLPNIPSADEVVAEGIDLGKMDAKLLSKIEELTLYLIDQQKEIEKLKIQVKNLGSNKK